MVMKPEPWGEALDAVLTPGATLVVPTPGGAPFTQAVARELAAREHLVVACGRYEGIDQRVPDHYAATHDVRELSIGDYVLNGGEVAALVVVEAVARLLPGFMGNAESLLEESHEDGLLEYPGYTKPARWRGHDVPPVLLSGDHAAIAAWRHQQSLARTAERRPDLLPASAVPGAEEVRHAVPADAGEILTLQRACWMQEQQANPDAWVPALHESLDDVRRWLPEWTVLTLRRAGRLVAAARARVRGGRVGRRAADGRAGPAGPGARPAHAGGGRGGGPRRRHDVLPLHGRGEHRQPPVLQARRLPDAGRAPRRPGCGDG